MTEVLSPTALSAYLNTFNKFAHSKDSTTAQNPYLRHAASRQPRPVSWHTPSPAVTVANDNSSERSLDPVNNPLRRQNSLRRGRELPPLPEGEHDVAARSRIRNKAERRRSRSTQRRHDVNPTQSLRSSRRRDSSASNTNSPPHIVIDEVKATKQKNRRSAPLPQHPADFDDLKKLKQDNRRSAPLPPRLPMIPASPAAPIFRDPWLEEAYRSITGITQPPQLLDGLISPKSKVARPALLTRLPAKASPTTCLTDVHITRKRRDISHVPVSAMKHTWGVFIDDRGPPVSQHIFVSRRPSTGWSLERPDPIATMFAEINDTRALLESRGWNETQRGTRHFNASGFWM